MKESLPLTWEQAQHAIGAGGIASSFVVHESAAFWLEGAGAAKVLCLLAPQTSHHLDQFHGTATPYGDDFVVKRCPTDAANARALRDTLSWLTPRPLGLVTSAGCGDRLGLATPGHVHAFQHVQKAVPGHAIAPIFAQQSIREMTRTQRTPTMVLDDATWGAFQAGWQRPVGADADHLKTEADIDACAAVGFSFYTIDPGAYVDAEADEATAEQLHNKVNVLPWDILESSEASLLEKYVGLTIDLEHSAISLQAADVMRAAAKYGHAVAHVVRMYRHLMTKGIPFELEVSVDETETPTSPTEHIYIVSELRRLGIQWVSLAPRYPGRFEKGIDYIGDLDALSESMTIHADISRALGPYKLSLHSGSDKFSIYPLFASKMNGLIHLKTAGTSYVEALRVIAQTDPGLFRQILQSAYAHYGTDRASYHVSAISDLIPNGNQLTDAALPGLIDELNTRQVIHVTFGSILSIFGAAITSNLIANQAVYDEILERHFSRHLLPFASNATTC
jgi:tagaturonate epimerase